VRDRLEVSAKEQDMAEACGIRCQVGSGIFDDELLVRIKALAPDGTTFEASSLVARESVELAGDRQSGVLHAYCMSNQGDPVSVILPQTTLENGPSVLVPRSEIAER
jgi:hypothetical protein